MATRSTPSDPVPEEEAAAPSGRFGLLLVFLICAYLLSAFVAGRWVTLGQIFLATLVARLVAQFRTPRERQH